MKPRTAIVEVVPLSGYTESGIYVLDHHEAKSMESRQVSLLYRVTVANDCLEIRVGDVVGLVNPYAFTVLNHEGAEYRVIAEENAEYVLEGYAEEMERLTDHEGARDYPVCAKA